MEILIHSVKRELQADPVSEIDVSQDMGVGIASGIVAATDGGLTQA